jgi:hypothetical protein
VNPELLAERLRDIRELDPVSWWPPGPGWWFLVLGGILLLLLLWRFAPSLRLPRRPRRRLRWQRVAARELHELRRRVHQDDPKTVAGELSELLRRIAMARCGRANCAGLSGEAWLDWLQRHDPAGYDWRRHGQLLAVAPYAPPGHAGNTALLQELVDAAIAWTRPGAAACAREEAASAV